MPFSLRAATNLDGPAVRDLVFTVLAEYGLKSDPEGIDGDLNDLEEYGRGGGAFSVLVDETGEVIGSIGIHRVSPATCEIRKMYLARRARGKGLGRHLLEHGLEMASGLGFSRIILETAAVLREATQLYEGFGFRLYEPDHLASRCDKAYYLDLPADFGKGGRTSEPAPD